LPKEKTKPLSRRLFAIAESLPAGGVVCDVGSDHGLLPVFLLQSGKCQHCIVTDLNPAPLSRAKKTVQNAGLEPRVRLLLADGIREPLRFLPDALVIAGMGGETILEILEKGKREIPQGTFFSLQPMTREVVLRRFLYENGFSIEKEEIVEENGKLFPIFSARYDGIERKREALFYLLGEFLPQKREPAVRAYFEKLLARTLHRIEGLKKANLSYDVENKAVQVLCTALEAFHEDL